METAQDDAVVAALRADDQPVTEMPAIYSVTIGGPAHDKLLPGDLVVSVDGVPTPTTRRRTQGDPAARGRREGRLRASSGTGCRPRSRSPPPSRPTQAGSPVVGITLGTGYRYQPEISFDFGQRIGGPSAGLVFALAIYDKITDGPLLAGLHVAGTGRSPPTGEVGSIGGIQEKIAGAEKAGATVFLVPAGNCADLAGREDRHDPGQGGHAAGRDRARCRC